MITNQLANQPTLTSQEISLETASYRFGSVLGLTLHQPTDQPIPSSAGWHPWQATASPLAPLAACNSRHKSTEHLCYIYIQVIMLAT